MENVEQFAKWFEWILKKVLDWKMHGKKKIDEQVRLQDLKVPPEALLLQSNLKRSEESENTEENPDILKGTSNEPDDVNDILLTMSKIEQLEKRQKEIEEENKRKRQLLLKAIADRRQKTSEETLKLHNVQIELQRLDLLVAKDVKILRQAIDQASLEFSESR